MSLRIVRRGMLVVISAPSGCGKSSIVRGVLPRLDSIRYSISATSRSPRGEEIDGRDYYFLSREEFEREVTAGAFLEHAEVHGHHYGTPRKPIEESLNAGIDVMLDIDVQGGLQIRQEAPESLLIFILPPSMETLEQRLRKRDTDSEETIRTRMENARHEMTFWPQYDYAVVNENLDEAIRTVENIIRAERCRTLRLSLEA